MRQKSVAPSSPSERLVKTIRRATRKQYSAEEKIRNQVKHALAERDLETTVGIHNSVRSTDRLSAFK
jgi:hypothetical protein